MVFDLIDRLAPLPKPFDAHAQRALMPDPMREKTLVGHIRECHARYVELRTVQQDQRIEQAKTHRLLLILLALMVGDNIETVQKIWAFVAN